jgi:Tubulin-tyrosine ligase family
MTGNLDASSLTLTSADIGERLQMKLILQQLGDRVTQWDLDGPDNLWILKPGGKSRGRGIHCFNSLRKLQTQVLLVRV